MRNAYLGKQFPPIERDRAYQQRKRMMDIVVALVCSLVFLPLICVTALIVAANVGWPLIFQQVRAGRGGRPIVIYKFRTMGPSHDTHGRSLTDAERTSAAGQFLRRTRLDELPQLFNVLKGDMSLVGPRPLIAEEQDQAVAMRLAVRPGLTGWAQINGGRVLSIAEKARLDTWYVHNASFGLDARILLRTAHLLVSGSIDTTPRRSARESGGDHGFARHAAMRALLHTAAGRQTTK